MKNDTTIMVLSEQVADSECDEEPIRLGACFFFCIGREDTILMNFSSKLRTSQPRNPCAVANTFFIGHIDLGEMCVEIPFSGLELSKSHVAGTLSGKGNIVHLG